MCLHHKVRDIEFGLGSYYIIDSFFQILMAFLGSLGVGIQLLTGHQVEFVKLIAIVAFLTTAAYQLEIASEPMFVI